VAVGAQDDEVLETVVVFDSVEVMQTQREWSASPVGDAAFSAPLFEQWPSA
jgi:hypothetical protein